jgi:two-component system sensor histidine kinase YesM
LLLKFYYNLSIKYKILIFFYIIIIIIASALGYYSTKTSEKIVLSKVSSANLGIIKQINSNLDFLKQDIEDITTYICIDDNVQSLLQNSNKQGNTISESNITDNNSLKFIITLIAAKSYISSLILYSNNETPIYYEFTDLSSGAQPLSTVGQSSVFTNAVRLNGTILWFPMLSRDSIFIQNNMHPKIGACRMIKDYSYLKQIGFLWIGINESVIHDLCVNNIQNDKEGMLIVDEEGNTISNSGVSLKNSNFRTSAFYISSLKNTEGYTTDTINGLQYLVTYSQMKSGWRTFYAVPTYTLKKEINSVKSYTIFVIVLCLLFSMPLLMLMLSFLTAPIKKLLKSMKRFQQGNFDERVEFKYKDEIGQLGEGYNKMVVNIKELISKAYILQIKEREAELDALQAQINPHFLYNTLDTIFWKAKMKNENEISDMVYSLSKLFRLSLNRGKELTLVSMEKELLEHYLMLQKVRFKNKLNYNINIDDSIMNYTIPKLILQPFVENSILHGIEGKEVGGTVNISGCLKNDKLCFVIEDDGIGMDEQQIGKVFETEEDGSNIPSAVSGGYAVKNVNERLKIIFKDDFSLNFTSSPGEGTRVEIILPARETQEYKEDGNDSSFDH